MPTGSPLPSAAPARGERLLRQRVLEVLAAEAGLCKTPRSMGMNDAQSFVSHRIHHGTKCFDFIDVKRRPEIQFYPHRCGMSYKILLQATSALLGQKRQRTNYCFGLRTFIANCGYCMPCLQSGATSSATLVTCLNPQADSAREGSSAGPRFTCRLVDLARLDEVPFASHAFASTSTPTRVHISEYRM